MNYIKIEDQYINMGLVRHITYGYEGRAIAYCELWFDDQSCVRVHDMQALEHYLAKHAIDIADQLVRDNMVSKATQQ